MITDGIVKRSVYLFRNALLGIGFCFFLIQIYLDSSYENTVCNFICISVFSLSVFTCLKPRTGFIGKSFVSTIVFISIAGNSLCPMIGTALEGNSLTYTLINPVYTFLNRTLFSCVLIISMLCSFSLFSYPLKSSVSKIGSIIKTRVIISEKGLWLIGLFAFALSLSKQMPIPVTLQKFLDGFGFLVYAPFLLLLPPFSNTKGQVSRKLYLSVYYLCLSILSLAGNSRMGMVAPLATIAIGWVMLLQLGYITLGKQIIKKVIVIIIPSFFLLGQFKDISTAILIERGYRSNRNLKEQFISTYDRFLDKRSLREFEFFILNERYVSNARQEWQENYVSNPLLARFISIKYDDNCFDRIEGFSNYQSISLRNATVDKLVAIFPDPVLNFFAYKLDKIKINENSIGDLIENIGGNGVLGSKRTGSIPAHCMALLGQYAFLIVFILYFLVFSIINGLVSNYNKNQVSENHYSTFSLIVLFRIYTDLNYDGLTSISSFLLRGIWQLLLMYFLVQMFLKIFSGKSLYGYLKLDS